MKEVEVGRVSDTKENAAACICAGCPSKTEDGMSLYCARGKSSMAVERGFCACKWCPLWSGYALEKDFYCAEGADQG
jgi:hypothetical protein